MKVNTLSTYPLTGTYQGYSDTQDPTNGTVLRTYFDSGTLNLRMILNARENLMVYTHATLLRGWRIRGVLDAAGEPVEEDTVYEVRRIVPVLNVFGYSDGHAYEVFRVVA